MDDLLLGEEDSDLLEDLASTRSESETPSHAADPRFVEARALVTRLCGRDAKKPAPRTRIGVVHLAPQFLEDEKNLAVRLGAEQVSLARCVLDGAPPESRWLGLDAGSLLRHLDALASETISLQRPGECLLLAHADLILAALSTRERAFFWREAFANLPHRARALLLVLPQNATALQPAADDWTLWKEAGRSADVV